MYCKTPIANYCWPALFFVTSFALEFVALISKVFAHWDTEGAAGLSGALCRCHLDNLPAGLRDRQASLAIIGEDVKGMKISTSV
jgi:hypothetical protein